MSTNSFRHTAGGIDWYCESQGTGPQVVLVPSGEGDCAAFAATMAALSRDFSVLTFDTPGFSRSGPPADADQLRFGNVGAQVAALVRSLGIQQATFYGCSSGGRAVLDLLLDHGDLVRNAIVHEVALPMPQLPPPMQALVAQSDEGMVAGCKLLFSKVLVEDEAKWLGMGEDYHRRLERNYPTWVRRYLALGSGEPIDPARLRGRPLTWTVGSLSDPKMFASNLALATAAGFEVGTLPCRHFPQVTVPAPLAAHIADSSRPFLS